MELVTLTIAVLASLIAFLTRPIWSLVVYFALLALYPSYLTIKFGTIDFTVCRILIMVIFLTVFLRTDLAQRFRFILLDKLIIIYMIAQILAGFTTTTDAMQLLENRSGAVFDLMLPYFAVRLIITQKSDYILLLKCILIIAAPLAIVGFYQCLTGNNPVGFLKGYRAWSTGSGYSPISRFGLYRADVTFPMSIMFGLFFAELGPMCAGLTKHIKEENIIYLYIGLALAVVGVFSSMSSGALMAAIFALMFLAFYPYRRYWKQAVFVIVVMCVAVEIISNRHFYDVVDRFTFSTGSAWYRSRLMKVALGGGMSGHWLTGFGFADPGWSKQIDGSSYTDIVNHYLLILARYGLVGFIPFVCVIFTGLKRLVAAYRNAVTASDRWLIWTLAAAFCGLLGGFFSVSLFGQPRIIFYMMFGFCGVTDKIITKQPKLNSI
jgi:hypothetical protein